MPKQTRSERRARRAAQAESRAAVERAPQRQPQPAARAAPEAPQERDGHHVPGERGMNFVQESWAELKKVDWPGQNQLIQGTAVVLIACLVTGVYLFLADEIFRRLVEHVLLR